MRSPVVWLAVVEPRRVESRTLSEPESKALVAAYGVPVPIEATATNAVEAAEKPDRSSVLPVPLFHRVITGLTFLVKS